MCIYQNNEKLGFYNLQVAKWSISSMIYIKGTYFAEIRSNRHNFLTMGQQNLHHGEEFNSFGRSSPFTVASLSPTYPTTSHIPATSMWR